MGMMALLGAGGGIQPLPGGTASSIAISPSNATANWEFNDDGSVVRAQNGSSAVVHYWRTPPHEGAGDGYYLRATKQSGDDLTSGSMGSWLQLNVDRIYQLSITADGASSLSSTVLFEIATDSGGVNVVTSGTYIFSAEVTL